MMEDNRKVTKFFYWLVGSFLVLTNFALLLSGQYLVLGVILITVLLSAVVFIGFTLFNLIVFTPVLWLMSLLREKMDSRTKSEKTNEIVGDLDDYGK